MVFRVGAERFALPLESLREVVVPRPPFAKVPRAPGAVRGAMNLRGRVVAVVDLAQLVGLAEQPFAGGQGQVLILDRDRRGLGLLVGGVLGVEPLLAESTRAGLLCGVAQGSGGAVTLLDPEALAIEAEALFGAR
ncbi:MAG TPA: chemotaxis protein CheW [Anaeromyxobacteraceae bacterium]|nr:chemotaxis protein CheW [Anaeromyxobacteraceae bacterium]